MKWAEGKIEERGYNLERQEITRADTREMRLSQVYPFVKMIPLSGENSPWEVPISVGPRAGDSKRRVRVELSSFEIMDAPVTQRFWVEVMRENPSRLKNRRHCKNHTFIGEIELCPDLPVESVSWDDRPEVYREA